MLLLLGRSHERGGRKPSSRNSTDFEERAGGDLSGCGVAQVNAEKPVPGTQRLLSDRLRPVCWQDQRCFSLRTPPSRYESL